MDKDTHELLIQAYLDYFKAHDRFKISNSVRNHVAARRHLREIRRLAKLRMDEIHISHNEIKQTKREAAKNKAR